MDGSNIPWRDCQLMHSITVKAVELEISAEVLFFACMSLQGAFAAV